MVNTAESPLILAKQLRQSKVQPGDAGVKLGEQALLAYFNLRGQGPAFAEAIQAHTGLELPTRPNTVSEDGEQLLCWLGPDESLLILPAAEPSEQDDLLGKLRTALNGQPAAVVDTSSGLTVITLSGPKARSVLAKGCTLDLHVREFGAGRCAQTVLAKASVLLIPQGDHRLSVVVRRSFADYLWRWLVDAAEEYGLVVV